MQTRISDRRKQRRMSRSQTSVGVPEKGCEQVLPTVYIICRKVKYTKDWEKNRNVEKLKKMETLTASRFSWDLSSVETARYTGSFGGDRKRPAGVGTKILPQLFHGVDKISFIDAVGSSRRESSLSEGIWNILWNHSGTKASQRQAKFVVDIIEADICEDSEGSL